MRELLQDIRYGARVLLKNPAFSAAAILILALGTGANTAVFSTLNAVVLRLLPDPDPDRLYQIESVATQGGKWVSAPNPASWRQQTRVFEKMAAARPIAMILSGDDEPEQLFGLEVSRE